MELIIDITELKNTINEKELEEILEKRDLEYLKRKRISIKKSKLLNNINYHCEMIYEHTRRSVELKEDIYLKLAMEHILRCKRILCEEIRKKENKKWMK